jgi:putative phage-type endonuclease
MTTIIRPKDHAEWLQHRSFGIGSSEVATIVGLNPWESKYQLWRRKKGLDPAKEETFAMKAGHYLEDAVSRFWEDETGNHVIKSSAGDWIAVDTQSPWLRVSPDRTYFLGRKRLTCNKGILECKTTNSFPVMKDLRTGSFPDRWYCQMMHYLAVTGKKKAYLAVLVASRDFYWF